MRHRWDRDDAPKDDELRVYSDEELDDIRRGRWEGLAVLGVVMIAAGVVGYLWFTADLSALGFQ